MDGEEISGAIVLGGDEVLLGMDFIRSLDTTLILGKSYVLLGEGWEGRDG